MELRREEAASFKMEDCSGVIPVTVNGSKLAKQLLMKATVVKKMRRVCMINKILCFGK